MSKLKNTLTINQYEDIIKQLEVDVHYLTIEREYLIELIGDMFMICMKSNINLPQALSHPSNRNKFESIRSYVFKEEDEL